MQRVLFVLLWTGLAATAQFYDVAVTDDGQQVYFVSSLPLHGDTGGGIFRWTGERFERFATEPPADTSLIPVPTRRGRPVTDGGGKIVAWTDERRYCQNSLCMSSRTTWSSTLTIAGGSPPVTLEGQLQISRNGRYVIRFGESGELRDLTNGAISPIDVALSSSTQSLTSDGRVLGYDNTSMILWSSSGRRRVGPGFTGGVISDNGARVVAASGNTDLVAIDVETGAQVPIGPGHTPVISNDGSRVIFFDGEPWQLWLASTFSGERRQLINVGAPGIRSAVLAGFGHTAFAATSDGRILRIDVNSGATTDLISRTPIVVAPVAATPCDALRLNAYHVPVSESPPVTLDGVRLPVLSRGIDSRGIDEIWVQVPCETTPSEAPSRLDITSDSPFDTSQSLSIRRIYPTRLPDGTHQDFSGIVTRTAPARPGEVLHFWGSGFGAVDRQRRTGEPGPVSPPAKLIDPIQCRQSISSAPIEVTFAGLAPGLTGVYQLDLRVPSDAQGWLPVTCRFAEDKEMNIYVPFIA